MSTRPARSSVLLDQLGGSMVQTLILVSLVALAGLAGFKALGSSTSERADCASKMVDALAAVPCSDATGGPQAPAEPPPAPEPGPEPPASDESNPLEELEQLALDIFGITDAVNCFTEGDILACALTIVSFTPWKLATVIGKLVANAARIKRLVDRVLEFLRRNRRGPDAPTGTVWDDVKPTQPPWPGTVVPRSFELSTGSGRVWVHGNATEHIAERATAMLNRGVSREAVDLATQQQIRSLQAAVESATRNGVPFGQLIRVGGWELKFAPPRGPGQLPALIHALPL
jgi:hypothetical protein